MMYHLFMQVTSLSFALIIPPHPEILGVYVDDFRVGVAFVISQERGLVATAGHVADTIKEGNLRVAANDQDVGWDVLRVWFHPAVLRRVETGVFAQTADIDAGPIAIEYCYTPDVAILQLDVDSFPLPKACTLSGANTTRSLAQHNGVFYVKFDQSPKYLWGQFRGLAVNESMSEAWSPLRILVNSTFRAGKGTSGSPVYLTDGTVAAVHVGEIDDESGAKVPSPSMDVKVDALREIIAYYHLDQNLARHSLLSRETRDDWDSPSNMKLIHKLAGLMKSAKEATQVGALAKAAGYCDEILKLNPNCVPAYSLRSLVNAELVSRERETLPADERRRLISQSMADAQRGSAIFPDDLVSSIAYASSMRMAAREGMSTWREHEQCINDLLPKKPWSDDERAILLSYRSECRLARKDVEGAWNDCLDAISMASFELSVLEQSARVSDSRGDTKLAKRYRDRIQKLSFVQLASPIAVWMDCQQ